MLENVMRIYYEETIENYSSYSFPMIALFNINKISEEEVRECLSIGRNSPDIIRVSENQYKSVFEK